MLWDGLGFFGADHMKLGRLKGEKVDFCTPFKSPRILFIGLLGLGIGLYIVLTEIYNLGQEKSQTISLVQDEDFSYHFSDAIALHAGNWWNVDRAFNHIREHQIRNKTETN